MGICCPCGVLVKASTQYHFVIFDNWNWPVEGELVYNADVKITNLADSTLTLQFVDTETPEDHSFLFTAKKISSIECQPSGKCCLITVTGTGIVNEVEYPFKAVFRDEGSAPGDDSVYSFDITGFFNHNGRAKIMSGSITANGCESC